MFLFFYPVTMAVFPTRSGVGVLAVMKQTGRIVLLYVTASFSLSSEMSFEVRPLL